jgi:hypothetical protein
MAHVSTPPLPAVAAQPTTPHRPVHVAKCPKKPVPYRSTTYLARLDLKPELMPEELTAEQRQETVADRIFARRVRSIHDCAASASCILSLGPLAVYACDCYLNDRRQEQQQKEAEPACFYRRRTAKATTATAPTTVKAKATTAKAAKAAATTTTAKATATATMAKATTAKAVKVAATATATTAKAVKVAATATASTAKATRVLAPTTAPPANGHTVNPRQPHLNEAMRQLVVDWMFDVFHKFRLMDETLFLAVHLLDRYCAVGPPCPRKKYQLWCCTAMFVASKFEEIYVPEPSDFVMISDCCFTREDLLCKEAELVEALDWRLWVVTPYRFVNAFLHALGGDYKLRRAARLVAKLGMTEMTFSSLRPSLRAFACVLHALEHREAMVGPPIIPPPATHEKTVANLERYAGYRVADPPTQQAYILLGKAVKEATGPSARKGGLKLLARAGIERWL